VNKSTRQVPKWPSLHHSRTSGVSLSIGVCQLSFTIGSCSVLFNDADSSGEPWRKEAHFC
jgi:hypothetical protein